MIGEIITEVIAPAIGRILSYILIEIIGNIVCYNLGYGFSKVVTFGKYPETYFPPEGSSKQETILMCIGILVFFLSVVSIFMLV